MAKKVSIPIDENEMLARMAGVNNYQPQPTVQPAMFVSPKDEEILIKEKGKESEQLLRISKEVPGGGNGKRGAYEEKYLTRTIYGAYRGNVGISKNTLDIAEKVIARIFDNRIAIGVFIDNILWEHFNKYKKDYELWLAEKPTVLF
jgi:hypothetical protein